MSNIIHNGTTIYICPSTTIFTSITNHNTKCTSIRHRPFSICPPTFRFPGYSASAINMTACPGCGAFYTLLTVATTSSSSSTIVELEPRGPTNRQTSRTVRQYTVQRQSNLQRGAEAARAWLWRNHGPYSHSVFDVINVNWDISTRLILAKVSY